MYYRMMWLSQKWLESCGIRYCTMPNTLCYISRWVQLQRFSCVDHFCSKVFTKNREIAFERKFDTIWSPDVTPCDYLVMSLLEVFLHVSAWIVAQVERCYTSSYFQDTRWNDLSLQYCAGHYLSPDDCAYTWCASHWKCVTCRLWFVLLYQVYLFKTASTNTTPPVGQKVIIITRFFFALKPKSACL